ARLLTHDREYRHVVHPRVVQTIQQMDCARARRGQTDADFASELGVATGHEGGHFLMPHAHVVKAIRGAPHRTHDAVDAVTGVAKDPADAPVRETLEDEIADGVTHALLRAWLQMKEPSPASTPR